MTGRTFVRLNRDGVCSEGGLKRNIRFGRAGDSSETPSTMRKYPLSPKFDPLDFQIGIELVAGGIIALMLMRWLGM